MKNKIKIGILIACMAVTAVGSYAMQSSLAYLSDQTDVVNKFTVGNVTAEIVETFNPVTLKVGMNSYTKNVKVQNSGRVPAYARVWLSFTDCDVEKMSWLSCDGGNTWYSLSELRNHLPSGWAYESSGTLGGYYYYRNPVPPGGKTPVLITNVKTNFINKTGDTNETINKTPRNYDVLVYAETVQQAKLNGSGLNDSYRDAWTAFLNKK